MKRSVSAAILGGLLALAPVAFAQTVGAPAQRPPSKPLMMPGMAPAPVRKPSRSLLDSSSAQTRIARATPVHRTSLSNGFTLLTSESPQEDIVSLELLIHVGQMEEKSPVSGITTVVQEILHDRISKAADGEDQLEVTGTVLRVSAEPDYARVSLQTTSANAEKFLAAMAAALSKRPVTQKELEHARHRLITRFTDGQGAMTQLYDIFRQSFYRYHPYRSESHGSKLAIERLDPKAVELYMNEFFVPNRMVMAVAGRIDRIALEDVAKKSFSAMSSVDSHQLDISWEPKSFEKEVYLSGGTTLGWLFVGYPAPSATSKDYATMKIIQALMGEGLSSRLFTEIREKRSLCYELGSSYPVLRGPAHFLTYTITKPEQLNSAKKQLLREMDRLKKEGITQRELEDNRRKVIGSFLLDRETNQGKAFHLALDEISGTGFEYEETFLRDLKSVTTGEVLDVAKRYLDNYTMIVARPGGRFYLDL